MKKFIFFFFILSNYGVCQTADILSEIATTSSNFEGQALIAYRVQLFAAQLKKERPKSDFRFLQKVFYKTHSTFLKEYTPYGSMDQLITKGIYDCLTATSLYSSILEILGFNFRIIETNYHIFIIVNSNGRDVLFETTDPLNGFISNQEEIERRMIRYKSQLPSVRQNQAQVYEYDFHLLNEVKGNQLAGLLYFNQAVKEFNQQNWVTCKVLLTKSGKLYDSPRVVEIIEIVNYKTANLSSKRTTNAEVNSLTATTKENLE